MGPHSSRAPEGRGQHFLNLRRARQFVDSAGVGPRDLVVEIGAGNGVVTRLLAARAGRVLALEIDPSLGSRLARRFQSFAGVHVVVGDALWYPLPAEPFRVLGNMPFAITTALLRKLLAGGGGALTRADLIVEWGAALKRTQPGKMLNISWAPWWVIRRGGRIRAREFGIHPPGWMPPCSPSLAAIRHCSTPGSGRLSSDSWRAPFEEDCSRIPFLVECFGGRRSPARRGPQISPPSSGFACIASVAPGAARRIPGDQRFLLGRARSAAWSARFWSIRSGWFLQ